VTGVVTGRLASTIVLGAGPGGLGPLVYAGQSGLLDRWLERGVVVLERRARASSALSQYALRADSFGTSFLECTEVADPHPFLVRLRESEEGAALRPFREERPPLALAGAFLARLEAELEGAMAAHPRSRFVREQEVRAIHVQSDRVAVECAPRGGRLADERWSGETAVVAFGGGQSMHDCAAASVGSLGTLGALAGERLRSSDALLTEEGIREALGELARAARPEVVVVGGSHNAFSVAWLLTTRAADGLLDAGALAIVARRPPRIFYRTLEGAEADGYRAFAADDVCPRTRRLHQLGGLRGDGRELWRRIAGRPGTTPEPRVVLLDASHENEDEVRARIRRATLVVAATGYRPRLPRVLRDGREIPLLASRGGPSVDERCRLLDADSRPIDRLFSLGMASGFVPSGSMGGEPSFRGHTNGVWLYQHHIGASVHAGIADVHQRGRA
jgi:hypothetical protein